RISNFNCMRYLRHILLPVLLLILLAVSYSYLNGLPFVIHAQGTGATGTVTFGTVGDSGASTNAQAVFSSAKGANLNLFVHLGDLSYQQQGGPGPWSTWVKGIIGTTLPFEWVSGNHDDCCVQQYVQGLPDQVGGINGTYGQNYYFDYPN